MNRVQRSLRAVIVAGFALTSLPAFAQPLNLVMRLAERVPLQELAEAVTDARSPRFNKFYSPEEIRALSGPSQVEYDATLAALKQEGLQVVAASPTHLWITVRADHLVIESVFNTKFKFEHLGTFYTTRKPTIPAELKLVQGVSGFDNLLKRKPLYTVALPTPAPSATPQPGILPAQIKTAYSYDAIYKAGWTGKGQHIAIATYDGFYIDDINSYYQMIKLPVAPVVDQVIFNGTPVVNDGSAAETQLDAEFSGMIAPGAQIHIFASADNSDAGEEGMFTAILDDNRARAVNYSWGACENLTTPDHRTTMDKVFARAVAQGVNIMVATGDSGADSCQTGGKEADWPAAHPNVVAVGGTTISLSSSNELKSEAGWSLSGGGISGIYTTPSWQVSVLSGEFNKRSYPDVSFNADNKSGEAIWTHYGSFLPHWLVIGGTSMAAPQWTGLVTLANEARVAGGKAESGFLDPILYQGATTSSSEYETLFHDITKGNNGYAAGKGWDAVTGWGSPKADAILAYILAQ